LRSKTGLKPSDYVLKRSRLNPISQKQRKKSAALSAQASREALVFKQAVFGMRCVVCGRMDTEARLETGYGHEAHHIVPKSRLKKLGRLELLWCPENAAPVCEEPCHRRLTQRRIRLTPVMLGRLYGVVAKWAAENGISLALEDELLGE
jgi:5-methylcytosine-specific restriction endonuclease McrA